MNSRIIARIINGREQALTITTVSIDLQVGYRKAVAVKSERVYTHSSTSNHDRFPAGIAAVAGDGIVKIAYPPHVRIAR